MISLMNSLLGIKSQFLPKALPPLVADVVCEQPLNISSTTTTNISTPTTSSHHLLQHPDHQIGPLYVLNGRLHRVRVSQSPASHGVSTEVGDLRQRVTLAGTLDVCTCESMEN